MRVRECFKNPREVVILYVMKRFPNYRILKHKRRIGTNQTAYGVLELGEHRVTLESIEIRRFLSLLWRLFNKHEVNRMMEKYGKEG